MAGERLIGSYERGPLRVEGFLLTHWAGLGHLQLLVSLQALDPLVVDLPAGVPQQGRNPPIAVTTVPAGQFDHVCDQAVLVVTAARDTTLGRAMLTQHPAGAAFRGPEPITNMVDALATTRGAQKFPYVGSGRGPLGYLPGRMRRLPKRSTPAWKPGWITVVESISSTMAGPSIAPPAGSR